jgi:hypothetical protein
MITIKSKETRFKKLGLKRIWVLPVWINSITLTDIDP